MSFFKSGIPILTSKIVCPVKTRIILFYVSLASINIKESNGRASILCKSGIHMSVGDYFSPMECELKG